MNDNKLPPHVIASRLAHRGNPHADGRSWACRVCTKLIDAKWSNPFQMWLPISNYWAGRPNVVEHAFCSAECSLLWKQSRDYLAQQAKAQEA